MDKVFLGFRYQEQPVRVIRDEDGAPWWVAADIGKIAGVKDVLAAVATLKEREKRAIPGKFLGVSYSTAEVLVVNAAGLVHWIRKTRGPEGKKVAAWCKQEHFPLLRTMGMEIIPWKACSPKNDAAAERPPTPEVVTPPVLPSPPILANNARSLTAFQYQSQAVRVIRGEDGEPWFVAVDVCKVLEIQNSRDAIKRLDDDERSQVIDPSTVDSNYGGNSKLNDKLNVVNESGLYSLILASRKPEAKAFKRWVTHEVLPTIRKTGAYVAPAAAAPRKRRGRLPLAERSSVMDAGLPVPYYRFYAAYLDVYPLHKKVLKDHVAAARAALLMVGRQLQVDPGLYVNGFGEPGASPADPALPSTTQAGTVVPFDDGRFLTATELAVELNLRHSTGSGDGKAVNELLIRSGLATRHRNGYVLPTAAGAPWAHLIPIIGSRGEALPHQQVKWRNNVLPLLRKTLRAQQAQESRARQGQLF